DAMVVGECEIHHGANRDRVVAVNLDDDRPLLHFAHPQDAGLWLIDDRKSVQIPLSPRIGDGKAAAREIVRADFLLGDSAAQTLDRARNSHHRHAFGGPYYRDQQAFVSIHRDAEIDFAGAPPSRPPPTRSSAEIP